MADGLLARLRRLLGAAAAPAALPAGERAALPALREALDAAERRARAAEAGAAEARRAAAEEVRRNVALLGAMTDVVLVFSREGEYLEVPPTRPDRLMRARGDTVGRRVTEVLPAAAADAFLATIARTLDEGSPQELEYQLPLAAGDTWFSARVSPMGPDRVLWVARDVTAQHRLREELRTTAETLRAIVAASPAPIVAVDVDGAVRQWNPAAERLFGWSAEEVIGRLAPVIAPERAPEREAIREATLGARRPVYLETTRMRRDGTEIPVGISTAPMIAPSGELSGAVVMYTDLTERNRERVAREESERRYRQLVEFSPDGILVHSGGRIVYANAPMARMVGVASPVELLGRSILSIVHPGTREEVTRRIQRVRETGMPNEPLEHLLVRDGGETLEVEALGVPFEMGGRPAVHVVYRDITARKRLEAQLRQAQKMEAIGQLAGGIAHDFNNMLAVIRSYSELLLGDRALSAPHRADVAEIQAAADHAATLTRQLLAFSRQQVLRRTVLDVRQVVSGIEALLRRLTVGQVTLVTELAAEPCPALVDGGQIEQVLLNLVVNARDAMPGGGTVTVATTVVPSDAPDGRSPGCVRLSVRDTGIGMDEATLQRAFEPFFTTKDVGAGTGLGLATVYGIVQQLDGRISVESAPGAGTCVLVDFPLVEQDAGSEDRVPGEERGGAAGGTAGTTTILVVDDEPSIRSVVRRTLEGDGHRVVEAPDGLAALALVERAHEPPGLVITDLMMPRLGGKETVSRLRARWPALPVLYLSGYGGEVPGGGARVESLAKPFTTEALRGAVRRLLAAARG